MRYYIICLGVMVMLLPVAAVAQEMHEDLLSLSTGLYDVGDDDEAVDFRLEYRWGQPFFWHLKPWAGAEVTSDTSVWAGGGVLLDLNVADRLWITPSFGAGLYDEGDSDLDLGHPIEFRLQIEASYEFNNQNRVGVAFSHLSNADLDDNNPGSEILSLYWHLPINQILR